MKKVLLFVVFIFGATIVESQIVTNSTQALPQINTLQNSADLQLTANVNQQLRANVRNFMPQNYVVFSQSGQVTIQGRASSQSEVDEVLAAARTTPGVAVVVNGIVTTR